MSDHETMQDDPSEPVPSEAELTDPRSDLRLLADALPQIVWTAQPDGGLDYFSRRWYDYTGMTTEQSRGWAWQSVVHPDDLPTCVERWADSVTTGEGFETEYRFKRAEDGVYRWHLGRALPIKNAQGAVVRWFGTCTDIDDQKRAELDLARLRERERHIAEVLQGAVQPVVTGGIPGLDMDYFYRPALEEAGIGGDFADAFALEKGCHALIVGDLSGKGLAAASQVATVRNMLRFALFTGNTIAEAITRLNYILLSNDLLDGFATLVVAAFDLPMQTLTYVSCGQEPALLRRNADGDVDELPPTGPVLGMSESASYQEHVIPLAPGDAFALYTDGLTEAGPNRRNMLGPAGLAAIFQKSQGTATQIKDQVISDVSDYAGGVFHDDVCLLVGIMQSVPPQTEGTPSPPF